MNADPAELQKFSDLAHRWWDPAGEFRPLHEINPLRLEWIDRHAGLAGKRVLDVGCGGGILAEAMATRGALVRGIDLSEKALRVAELHLLESGAGVVYEHASAEHYAAQHAAAFEVVTCMELLEHVPDPESMVAACARLAGHGGQVFFSTLNRNPKAYAFAVLGAEYVLGWLPRGTHQFGKLVRPEELEKALTNAGMSVMDRTGVTYNPLADRWQKSKDMDVNYMVVAEKLSAV